MADTFKFPNGGYDVTVVRKHDILDNIDEDSVDKEVMFALVEQCEMDASDYLRKGRWTGLPFIGNVRISKVRELECSSAQKELIKEAKETLDKDSYAMFRRQLTLENTKSIKQERLYLYLTSMAVKRNRKLYNKLCKEKGEAYARLFLYTCKVLTSVGGEDENE